MHMYTCLLQAAYRSRNIGFLAERLAKRINEIHIPHEIQLVEDALAAARGHGVLEGVLAALGGTRDIAAMVTASVATFTAAALKVVMTADSLSRLCGKARRR